MTKKLVFKSRNKKSYTSFNCQIYGSHMFFSCIYIFPVLRKLFEHQAIRLNVQTSSVGQAASVNAMIGPTQKCERKIITITLPLTN